MSNEILRREQIEVEMEKDLFGKEDDLKRLGEELKIKEQEFLGLLNEYQQKIKSN